jgi:hypothetical protein
MNGKRAKLIRKRTEELLTSIGIGYGDGCEEYEQEQNCHSWEVFKLPDGTIMRDPDGAAMLKPVKAPGTIRSKWKFKVLYKWMKKMYKQGDKSTEEILKASADQLVKMFDEKAEKGAK